MSLGATKDLLGVTTLISDPFKSQTNHRYITAKPLTMSGGDNLASVYPLLSDSETTGFETLAPSPREEWGVAFAILVCPLVASCTGFGHSGLLQTASSK